MVVVKVPANRGLGNGKRGRGRRRGSARWEIQESRCVVAISRMRPVLALQGQNKGLFHSEVLTGFYYLCASTASATRMCVRL